MFVCLFFTHLFPVRASATKLYMGYLHVQGKVKSYISIQKFDLQGTPLPKYKAMALYCVSAHRFFLSGLILRSSFDQLLIKKVLIN